MIYVDVNLLGWALHCPHSTEFSAQRLEKQVVGVAVVDTIFFSHLWIYISDGRGQEKINLAKKVL